MESQELSQKSEERPSHRVAKIRVSIPLLENHLPTGTKVLTVKFGDYDDIIELVVSHPSFDELAQGDLIPSRSLLFYRESCEHGHTYITKAEYGA